MNPITHVTTMGHHEKGTNEPFPAKKRAAAIGKMEFEYSQYTGPSTPPPPVRPGRMVWNGTVEAPIRPCDDE